MGKVTQLCKSLHIHQVRTSPYHPQAWHFREISLHLDADAKEANCQLFGLAKATKVLLFALCNIPNRDTDYSPYQLIHGLELHGSLELLYHGWFGGERECIDLGIG